MKFIEMTNRKNFRFDCFTNHHHQYNWERRSTIVWFFSGKKQQPTKCLFGGVEFRCCCFFIRSKIRYPLNSNIIQSSYIIIIDHLKNDQLKNYGHKVFFVIIYICWQITMNLCFDKLSRIIQKKIDECFFRTMIFYVK